MFEADVDPELVKLIAEVTLVWVLFGDASQVRLEPVPPRPGHLRAPARGRAPADRGAGHRRRDRGPRASTRGQRCCVGAALAPTDAALGASVMSNPRVPDQVRQRAQRRERAQRRHRDPDRARGDRRRRRRRGDRGRARAPAEPCCPWWWGCWSGVVVGGLGGAVTKLARKRGWLSEELAGPAVLALALLGYTGALLVDGNGFVAAFVGGLVFGNVAGRGGEKEVYFVEQSGALASMISWLIFGALAVPVIGDWWSWSVLLYVALSLTVVRMLPVALALLGAGFDRYSVAVHRLVRPSRPRLRSSSPCSPWRASATPEPKSWRSSRSRCWSAWSSTGSAPGRSRTGSRPSQEHSKPRT